MTELLTTTLHDTVAVLTIEREARRNAINDATLDELRAALIRVREEARVVIVTGSGNKAFSAGSDIKELAAYTPAQRSAHTLSGQKLLHEVEEYPRPVIAAIDGYCMGGGLELAMACDLRIAGDTAVFGLPEVGLHALPSWGGTFRLPRLVGVGRATEIILFDRRISAGEALAWGLVAEVVPLGESVNRARAIAERLAAGTDPGTVSRAKRLVAVGYGMPPRIAQEMEYLADLAQNASPALDAAFRVFGREK